LGKENLLMDWTKFNELAILVIDDDQFTRELIKTILKQVPTLTVYEAKNGREALATMSGMKLDMVLLDLYMPQMNGKEFIETVRRNNQYQSLPIVLITTDRLGQGELSDIGANYYLTKPFDFHNFLNSIYSFFEQETILNAT